MPTGADRLSVETICPRCLERHPAGSISRQYPTCPECSSEAVDVFVVAYEEFLHRNSVEQLEEMRDKWNARTGFLPEFKALVVGRIQDLLRAKHAL